ncbi:MAG: hypothetical protein EPO23_11465 [Xanthobacteraceae bacterium]|nr:MAG: hypothetical protein EPO23_11465 [Xanthobacteraceae bacterium]
MRDAPGALLRACLAGLFSLLCGPLAAQSLPDSLIAATPESRRSQPPFVRLARDEPAAASRIGRIPVYGTPAASGAAASGFDSLSRKRRKARAYPGARPPKAGLPSAASAPRRTPVAAAVAGTALGSPPRRRLRPDDDPFGAVGFYAGGLLTRTAVELSGGYDSNPARIATGKGSTVSMIAGELLMASNWSRHALNVDLRGSFTHYGDRPDCDCLPGSVPDTLDRPDVTGKAAGRVDVTRDLRIESEARLRVATDNPGSPDIAAGLSRYTTYASVGGSLGLVRRFNRLELGVSGGIDRTAYEWSRFTNGATASNHDRDYAQSTLTGRASYEMTPGVKPFVEASLDRRVHDLAADRSGYLRDSRGFTVKAGTTFELTRLITGEAAVGYLTRGYDDARLGDLSGLLTSASLVWSVTPLTTVKFTATSTIDETTLAGVPGVANRSYGAEISHALRRWLVGTLKFTAGNSDYVGAGRSDRSYSAAAALTYKLSRTMHLKGEFRRDWLQSSIPGSDYTANVVMLGLRFQR